MKILKLNLIPFLVLFFLSACSSSTLKKDEAVIIFPTSANQIADGSWKLAIHSWVFEKEEGDFSRKATQKVFSEIFEGLGVSEEQANSPLLKERLQWFLVDNKGKKTIRVDFSGKQETLSPTGSNGHATTMLTLQATNKIKAGSWVSISVEDKFQRGFTGEVQLIPENGLSIISDIDDTIKDSNVLDKKELIKNTFIQPYKTTQGFPEYYKKLQKEGVFFHYISASPWQLYPSMKPFMENNYPKGTFSLRNFRLKDSSFIKFLQSSANYKIDQISQIIKRYPKQEYILIGDSGEHDPEVYAEIYKQFPKNIKSIQIRAVRGSDLSEERFAKLYQLSPKALWRVFESPDYEQLKIK